MTTTSIWQALGLLALVVLVLILGASIINDSGPWDGGSYC